MNETVFDRIELIERYATKQEKVIIEFLRTHPIKDLLLFSITEFSEKVGIPGWLHRNFVTRCCGMAFAANIGLTHIFRR